MESWQPEGIRLLVLRKTGITAFHVGVFKNLAQLDLSDNAISDVVGTGIEQCSKLQTVCLSDNKIVKRDNLSHFKYVPSLTALQLDGNRDGNYIFFFFCFSLFFLIFMYLLFFSFPYPFFLGLFSLSFFFFVLVFLFRRVFLYWGLFIVSLYLINSLFR